MVPYSSGVPDIGQIQIIDEPTRPLCAIGLCPDAETEVDILRIGDSRDVIEREICEGMCREEEAVVAPLHRKCSNIFLKQKR